VIESRPSVTAERVAMRRAAHQVLDVPPIFEDPLASRIARLGADDLAREQAEGHARANRVRRALLAVRSRYTEDVLAGLAAEGVDQYVILGAGLDTFAYRNPYPGLRVFDVDHPATQAWKRERLVQTDIAVPASLTFAPIDFERERLSDVLMRGGFDPARPALFGWLGVVAYLELEAIRDVLRFVASCAAGSTIVFDYAIPPDRLQPHHRARFDELAGRVASLGEPWRTFFDPADLEASLRGLGFSEVEDVDADALNARYFQSRADGLIIEGVGRMAHLARARV
jgi:methyltransferase (TIGR00027 family)